MSESLKPIGGYFEWEFPSQRCSFPHDDGFLLNNARSALQLILQSQDNVKKVYLPYYTCDSVTLALEAIGVHYEQYHINSQLRLSDEIILQDNEYLIYTNYFGIMDSYCKELAEIYCDRLIVDNAQALYASHIEETHSIYSYRKFIGVPDGGAAISSSVQSINNIPIAKVYDRCGALLSRAEDEIASGHKLFKENDYKFREDGIFQMSILSRKILQSIDHSTIVERRRANFEFLHTALRDYNRLHIPCMDSFTSPLVYPFYVQEETLRKRLIDNKIFVAQYWPNVFDTCNEDMIEYKLVTHIMALPIDQRYDNEDMTRVVRIIKNGIIE